MAHSLTPAPAAAATTSIAKPEKTSHILSLGQQGVRTSLQISKSHETLDLKIVHRRTVSLGLTSAVLGWNVSDRSANAARKPPPQPPEEKKDPSLSGVQAKVLASKKRKEAMKQAMAKLREKGEPLNEPSE
ncbi:hypothetical protein SLA2020_142990 [Shorea laevis]